MRKSENALNPQTTLWRYMDLARFLTLINRKELHFARLHQFQKDDPSEGASSLSDPLFENDPEYIQRAALHLASSLPLVSCWHENDTESIAMWKLYVSGKEGVAIMTTVSSLIQLFSDGRELKLGRVVYRDVSDLEPPPEIFVFENGRCTGSTDVLPIERNIIFRKDRSYTHEQEVRAVIYDTYCGREAVFNTEQHHHLQRLALGLKPERRPGVNVPIDIGRLIQHIAVSPEFPSWGMESLQRAVDAALLPAPPIEVKRSVLP